MLLPHAPFHFISSLCFLISQDVFRVPVLLCNLLLSVSLTELTPSEMAVGHEMPPSFMLSAGYYSVFCTGG